MHLPALLLASLVFTPVAHAGFKAKKASDDELIACLDEQPDEVKRACMDFIVDKRVLQAGDALVALSAHGTTKVLRAHALGSLEKLGAVQAVPAAVRMATDDPEPNNRKKALVVLQKLATQADGAPVVIDRMAHDNDPDVRRKALAVAKKVTWEGMEQAMIDHGLSDGDPLIIRDAIYGLVAIQSTLARPAIYDATRALPEAERTSVLRNWAEHVLPQDIDFILSCLDDTDDDVAIYAGRALAAYGDKAHVDTLRAKAKEHGGKRADAFEDSAKELRKGK